MSLQNSPLPNRSSNTSDAAVSGLNLTLKPVEEFVFEGFAKRFINVFNCRAAWTSSTDKVQVIKRLYGDGANTYPYACFTLNSWTESTERGNTFMSSRIGYTSVLSTDQKRGYRVTFLPVDFALTVEFVTNSFDAIKTYASRMLFARRKGLLKFDITYGKTKFAVSVVPSESMSFPTREGDVDNVTEYTATSDVTIVGYISESVLIEQQIADTVEVDVRLDEPPPPGTEIYTYRRSRYRPEMDQNVDD